MSLRHLRPLVSGLLLAAAASAQATVIELGELVQLPNGVDSADHAHVAVNEEGDVLVVWQTGTTVIGQPTKQAEGVLLRRLSETTWQVPSQNDVILFGDPAAAVLGPNDSCQKPKAVATGDDFLVVWPRTDRISKRARLELARVVPGSGSNVTVETEAPGVGYAIDPDYLNGRAGFNVGVTRKEFTPDLPSGGAESVIYAVNPHQTSYNGQTGANVYEYRGWHVDFRTTPPIVSGPQVLVPRVIADDVTPYGSGRVPPSISETDQGGILLAHEEFRAAWRTGTGDEGRILLRHFPQAGGTSLQQGDDHTLLGDTLDRLQRRPSVSSSRLDGSDSFTLVWNELDPLGGNGTAHHYGVRIHAGQIQVADQDYPNHAAEPVGATCGFHGIDARFVLMTVEGAQGNFLQAWIPGPSRLIPIPLGYPVLSPERGCGALRDRLPGSGLPREQLLPFAFDAFDPSTGHQHIFLRIERL